MARQGVHGPATVQLEPMLVLGGAMRQAEQVREQTDRLRRWVMQVWRNEHPAWWYRLIARTGAAQFVGFIVIGMTESTVRGDGEEPAEFNPTGWAGWGSLLVGLVVAAYSYWSMENPKPPAERVPGKEWGDRAAGKGIWVAVGVFYATLMVSIFLVLGIDNVIDLLPLPRVLDGAVGVILLGSSLLLPVMLAKHAYRERYRQEIEVLEAVTPPGLRLAMDLNRRAEWFHSHAEALERTMDRPPRSRRRCSARSSWNISSSASCTSRPFAKPG